MSKVAGRKAAFMYGESGSEVAIADITDTALSVGNVPIDITTQGADGFITVLPDVQDSKQVTVTANFTFDSEASLSALIDASTTGALVAGAFTLIGSGVATDASFQCNTWSVSALSLTGGTTGAVTGSVTIASSGEYTYTAAADS